MRVSGSMCECENAGCASEPTSPRHKHTDQAHLVPSLCLARSQSGPCQTQTSWVTPLQKGSLLADAYQPHLLGPLHWRPPAFLTPIRAPGGLRLQGHQRLPCWAILWLATHLPSQSRILGQFCAGLLFQPNRESEARYSRIWV